MGKPENEQRRRAVAWALQLTENTSLAPQAFERALLEQYAQGMLTLDHLIDQLDTRVQHLLYRSQAVQSLSKGQLDDLLEESSHYNARHGITGVLCYSEGYFVQLLEGSPLEVHTLYARIRKDRRHHEVVLLHDAAGDQRMFPDWQMAFVSAQPHEYFWLLSHLEARRQQLLLPVVPIVDPHLTTLLQAFCKL